MRDGFESYRTELEGVRLTAESKDALKGRCPCGACRCQIRRS